MIFFNNNSYNSYNNIFQKDEAALKILDLLLALLHQVG